MHTNKVGLLGLQKRKSKTKCWDDCQYNFPWKEMDS